MKKLDKGRAAAMASCETGFEALQSMLKGEYTEESTGARTIRQTGGKDRHSKVFTARGPRDRRVRLSVATAIRFYDLQDRLGFEQPSKAVEWLLLHCQPSIQALPQLASLHPLRVATVSQPAAAYVDQHPKNQNIGQKTYETEQSIHHIQKEEKLSSYDTDAVMHQNHNYAPHPQYDSPFPLGTDDHLQDSIEEDPSQYSNPSSSGASSDHPISCSEVARPLCTNATLAEAIPITVNHTASSASVHQCSTSFAAAPSPAPIIHMNKRHRMQHYMQSEDGEARLIASNAGNGAAAASINLSHLGRSLGNSNRLSSQLSCPASFGNTADFNRLMINDEDTLLMGKFSLQGQLNIEDIQHIMRLPNLPSLTNYKPSQYMDITQQMFATQVNQLAANDTNVIQGACNQSSRKAEYMNGQACTSNNSMLTMNDSLQLYNKIAALQQVDELVCSNVYASPSPSESTSINTLAAAYNSKAGGNTNNNTLVDHDQAANILYRPDWNPPSGLQ